MDTCMTRTAEDDLHDELAGSVRAVLAINRYLVLGTIDESGTPWVTPLFFGADGEHRLFWVSSPRSRHSRNVAARPAIAGTVFDSTVAVGAAAGIYLVGRASIADPSDLTPGLSVLNDRLPKWQALSIADLDPANGLALYRADITEHFVLVRGGDPRIEDPVDRSVRVRIE